MKKLILFLAFLMSAFVYAETRQCNYQVMQDFEDHFQCQVGCVYHSDSMDEAYYEVGVSQADLQELLSIDKEETAKWMSKYGQNCVMSVMFIDYPYCGWYLFDLKDGELTIKSFETLEN